VVVTLGLTVPKAVIVRAALEYHWIVEPVPHDPDKAILLPAHKFAGAIPVGDKGTGVTVTCVLAAGPTQEVFTVLIHAAK
jgi:hypothetical protein